MNAMHTPTAPTAPTTQARTHRHLGAAVLLAAVAALGGCASTGSHSPTAQPVLYPNAAHNAMGAPAAQAALANCKNLAVSAGLSADERNNETARKAAQAAATTGVAAAIGTLVTGGNLNSAAKAGAGGAVLGGSTGAVAAAFDPAKANNTYRHFVQRCAGEKGLEIIGWN
jgi:hypothetical protein